ncbi:MAG: tail fiber domain-containing protein [Candidatus Kariarchaeaceae archaeon]|jgi:hypothetical protein
MKSFLINSLLIVSFILIPTLTLAQEVEVKLGGDTKSDAFVVKNGSDEVLLRVDGAKNFGVNTEQPAGIEIKGKGSGISISSSISISSGDNVDVKTAANVDGSGSINLTTGTSDHAGNINIKTGYSDISGGAIKLTTGTADGGGNDISLLSSGGIDLSTEGYKGITLKTGNSYDLNGIKIETGYNELGNNNIELIVGDDGIEGDSQGIILNPNGGVVTVIGAGTYTDTWTQASDKRYKSNVKPLLSLLDRVQLLQPVNYSWNKEEYPEKNFSDGKQIGLIAQEVEEIFPELVETNKDGYKSIDYSKLSVLLIQAMKEQQSEIDKQSDEINNMKSDIEELKSIILQNSNKFTSN